MDFIRTVTELSGRVAGSEDERNCQAMMAGRLHRAGMEAVVEGAVCDPQVPQVLLLHAATFVLAVALGVAAPGWAAGLSALALLSFWGELRGAPRILRRLLLRRITGNMVARLRSAPGSSRGALVLMAHADVASSSTLFHPWVKRFTTHRERPGRTIHPGALVLLAGAVQLVAILAQWPRQDLSYWSLLGLLGAALVHLGTAVLALDWWRAPPVQGALDNASGLAVVAAVAETLVRKPLQNAELWVVATGAREPEAGGAEAFLRQFAPSLDKERTAFVNLDELGQGTLHVVVAEGRWQRLEYRPTLPALCEDLRARPEFAAVGETEVVGMTDAGPPSRAGYRAVTLTSLVRGRRPVVLHTPEDRLEAVEPAALAQACDFTLALARRFDSWLAEHAQAAPEAPADGSARVPGSP
jgi:hypothetical protein